MRALSLEVPACKPTRASFEILIAAVQSSSNLSAFAFVAEQPQLRWRCAPPQHPKMLDASTLARGCL